MKKFFAIGILVFLNPAAAGDSKPQNRRVCEFAETGVTFDADFDGARLDEAVLEENGDYRIVIRPENQPINNSAWYAFRLSAETPQTIVIRLTYEGGRHRYHPKTSLDGSSWQLLPADRYRRTESGATLRVDVGPKPVWISAQEMIGLAELSAWTDKIAGLSFVEETVIGRSVGDRPIRQVTIGPEDPKYAVAIIGRQHPPEVTGTLALMEFVETLAGPGDLAEEFRRSFQVLSFPS